MACGSIHPDRSTVRCIATDGALHRNHFAVADGVPVEWPNTEWVPPPKREDRKGVARDFQDLAGQVPTERNTGPGPQAPHAAKTRAEAESERDEAIAQVDAAASQEWKDAAYAFLVAYVRAHETLFTDDLFEELSSLPGAREMRALGPIVLRMANEGLIEKTDEYRGRSQGRLASAPVWRSLIFQPVATPALRDFG